MKVLEVTGLEITFTMTPEEAAILSKALEDHVDDGGIEQWMHYSALAAAFDAASLASQFAQDASDKADSLANAWDLIRTGGRGGLPRGGALGAIAALSLGETDELEVLHRARSLHLAKQSDRARASEWTAFQGWQHTLEDAAAQYRAIWEAVATTTSDDIEGLLTPGQLTLLLQARQASQVAEGT
jgi:hypothetical protein